jgi:hypothetical protein
MIEWKPIPGTDGAYEASNTGLVRNTKTGRTLNPAKNPGGYYFVCIKIDGKTRSKGVHQLVASAFLTKPPAPNYGSIHVHHKNGDRSDNRVENVEYISNGLNTAIYHEVERKAKESAYAKSLGYYNWQRLVDAILSGKAKVIRTDGT